MWKCISTRLVLWVFWSWLASEYQFSNFTIVNYLQPIAVIRLSSRSPMPVPTTRPGLCIRQITIGMGEAQNSHVQMFFEHPAQAAALPVKMLLKLETRKERDRKRYYTERHLCLCISCVIALNRQDFKMGIWIVESQETYELYKANTIIFLCVFELTINTNMLSLSGSLSDRNVRRHKTKLISWWQPSKVLRTYWFVFQTILFLIFCPTFCKWLLPALFNIFLFIVINII